MIPVVGLSESGGGGMASVVSAVESLLGLIPSVISVITDNPILLAYLAAGFVGIGFMIFRRAKGAARG